MTYAPAEMLAGRAEWPRWALSAAVVLLAHAVAVFAFVNRPEESASESGAPVVLIELAPIPVAPPTPKTDLAPGPEETAPESPETAAAKAEPEKEREPEPEHVVKEEAPNPEVTLPPKVEDPPPEKKPPEKAQEEPRAASPTPTAPTSVEAPGPRPAGPEEGKVARPTATAILTWQRALVAHLQRYKRYPAHARHEQGVTTIAFTIGHDGRLLSSRIVHSSGFPILDEETLAMIRRAAPLPRPPAEMPDNKLSFVVPIRYSAR